eukprot:scaffold4433_cov35-Tisochrysis_lutea.AAC.2
MNGKVTAAAETERNAINEPSSTPGCVGRRVRDGASPGGSRRMTPHATRAPALPVTREHLPLTGGGPGCELSPRPRSSGSA